MKLCEEDEEKRTSIEGPWFSCTCGEHEESFEPKELYWVDDEELWWEGTEKPVDAGWYYDVCILDQMRPKNGWDSVVEFREKQEEKMHPDKREDLATFLHRLTWPECLVIKQGTFQTKLEPRRKPIR